MSLIYSHEEERREGKWRQQGEIRREEGLKDKREAQ